jgi:hypothetical protein
MAGIERAKFDHDPGWLGPRLATKGDFSVSEDFLSGQTLVRLRETGDLRGTGLKQHRKFTRENPSQLKTEIPTGRP